MTRLPNMYDSWPEDLVLRLTMSKQNTMSQDSDSSARSFSKSE
jgi:hypothetical protein